MKSQLRKRIIFLLKLAVVIFVFYLLFKNVNWQQFKFYLKKARWEVLLLAFFIYNLSILFHVVKWKLLVDIFTDKISFKKAIELYYKNLFFNLFLPTSVGGDVVRMYDTYKISGDKIAGPVSIFIERLLGFLSVSFVGIAVYFVLPAISHNKFWYLNFIFLPVIIFVFFLLFFSRSFVQKITAWIFPPFLAEKVDKIFLYFEKYWEEKEVLLKSFFILIIVQFLNGLTIYLVFKANSTTQFVVKNYFYYVGYISLLYFASIIPLSIGGLGIREGSFVVIFSTLGYSREFLLANSLFYTLVLYLTALEGIIPFLKSSYQKRELF